MRRTSLFGAVMNMRIWQVVGAALLIAAASSRAEAQDSPWSADVAIGFDNAVSGDFLSGDSGTFQGLPLEIFKTNWDEAYGRGLLLNFAAGYDFGENAELRAGFTYQSSGSDDLITIGNFRNGSLAANFDSYRAWGFDFGYRRYFSERAERFRPYAGGSIGFGGVSGISADLSVSPSFQAEGIDFYEGNASITFGGNGGVLYELTDRVSLDARLGLRYVSGLSDLESDLFTGLDDVNEGSSRWTIPLTVGAKFRF